MVIHRITNSYAGFAIVEPVADFPALVKCGDVYHIPAPATRWHVQDEFEFVYVASGVSSLEVGKELIMVQPGQLTVTYPKERHRINGVATERNHFLYVALDLPKLGPPGSALVSALRRKRARLLDHAHELEPALRGLTRQLARRDRGYEQVAQAQVHLILTLLTQLCQEIKPPRAPLTTRQPSTKTATNLESGVSIEVEAAIRFMQERLDRKLPIKDIAQATGWSSPYLHLRFRNEVGLPPHAYHLNLRLDAAKDALTLIDVPIVAIALEFGFGSSQHFSAAFTKNFGFSPRAWRARLVESGAGRKSGATPFIHPNEE